MLTLQAPAKINLTLEVLGQRQDGFHEIRSVIQTIALCDTLSFQLSQDVGISSVAPDWIAAECLVSKAVKLVQDATGCTRGVTIEVNKQIPLLSGLGGDSSDAAATLQGLDKLWGLGLTPPDLLELAAQLGSDVSFFLYGGTALITGRGEKVTALPPLPHRWMVLVVPDVPRLPEKTKQLYASLNASHYTDGHITEKFTTLLVKEQRISPLFNTFENVAFSRFSRLKLYREHLVKMGFKDVYLAGSGPTLFSLMEDRGQAEELYTLCQQQGMKTYLTETLKRIDQPD